MTNFVKILIISVLALSSACGGQIDDETAGQDELKASLNFEPFDAYKTAQEHAARYGKHPVAVGLQGNITSDQGSFQWSWTFQCDGSYYVDVSVSEKAVRVSSRGFRATLMGVASFDPANRSDRRHGALPEWCIAKLFDGMTRLASEYRKG